jgi:fibronectin type 3 domain-containing protein
MDSTSLTKDRDYSINYNNNTNAGTASIIINGIGNYTGTKTINFRIISSLDKVAGVSATANNEKTIELTWNQVSCASGYEIYIYKDAKKKYVKLDSVNHNSYTSKKLTAGATYKYKVRAFINVNGKTVYGSYSDVYKASTCTKKPSISAKVSKTNATISWKAVKGASGYEVYMSTSKNGDYEQIGTTTKNSKVTFTKKKLTKKQTYYFKVRTYIIINKVKVFSDYSSVKSVKVK